MDRQGPKPQRPSLLAGTDANPAESASAPRILADMEGRPRPAPAGSRRSKLLPLLFAALALALIGAWLLLPAMREGGDAASVASLPRTAPDPVAASRGAAVEPAITGATATNAATIHDEPVPAGAPADQGSANTTAPTTVAASAAAPAGATGPTPATVPASAAAPAPAIAAGDADAGSDSLPVAFAAKPAPSAVPRKAAASRLPGIDVRGSRDPDVDLLAALMAQMPALRSEPRPAQRVAFRPVPNDLSPFADESDGEAPAIERMRRCPAANTSAGVRCRETICAELRGRDSACPAPAARD